MADLTTAQKLDDARHKYHQLVTGALRVVIRDGNSTLEFTPANKGALKTYIGELEIQLAGETSPTTPKRSPAGVIF